MEKGKMIKNIESKIGEILRTPSLGRNLLVKREKRKYPAHSETEKSLPLSYYYFFLRGKPENF